MLFILVLSVPVCFALQFYIWIVWRGSWRLFGSLPALALLAGCIHGLVSDSNLWPFWITEFAPHGVGIAVALLIIRFIVRRVSRERVA
jgi:hypothetical protein